jgi:hypothetical protein
LSSVHGICYQNNIYENNIERNQIGVELSNGCTSSTSRNNIYLNNLIHNNIGICLTNSEVVSSCPSGNKFHQNNLMNNNISAEIQPYDPITRYCNNNWKRNYWNRPRILPIKVTSPEFIYSILNIDWRPAKSPNKF